MKLYESLISISALKETVPVAHPETSERGAKKHEI